MKTRLDAPTANGILACGVEIRGIEQGEQAWLRALRNVVGVVD